MMLSLSLSLSLYLDETVKGTRIKTYYLQYAETQTMQCQISMAKLDVLMDIESMADPKKFSSRKKNQHFKKHGTYVLVDEMVETKGYPPQLSLMATGTKWQSKKTAIIEFYCSDKSCGVLDVEAGTVKPYGTAKRCRVVFDIGHLRERLGDSQKGSHDEIMVNFECEFIGRCSHRAYFGMQPVVTT